MVGQCLGYGYACRLTIQNGLRPPPQQWGGRLRRPPHCCGIHNGAMYGYGNEPNLIHGRIRRIKTRPSLIQGELARYFYFPSTCKTVFGVAKQKVSILYNVFILFWVWVLQGCDFGIAVQKQK